MNKLIPLLLFTLYGCNVEPNEKPEDYKCTEEQLRLVQIDFDICNKSGYLSSYCYLQAKKTQCTPVLIEVLEE